MRLMSYGGASKAILLALIAVSIGGGVGSFWPQVGHAQQGIGYGTCTAGIPPVCVDPNLPTLKIADVVDWKPTSLSIVGNGTLEEPMVKIDMEGKIIYGKNYTPDAAAKTLWEAVGQARQPKDVEFNLPPKYLAALDEWRTESPLSVVDNSGNATPLATPNPPERNEFARAQIMWLLDPRVKALEGKDTTADEARLRKLSADQCAAIAKIAGGNLKRCGGGNPVPQADSESTTCIGECGGGGDITTGMVTQAQIDAARRIGKR